MASIFSVIQEDWLSWRWKQKSYKRFVTTYHLHGFISHKT